MFLFRSATVLEANADVRFNYSRVQKGVLRFSKDVKKSFCILKIFASSIAIKKIEEILYVE